MERTVIQRIAEFVQMCESNRKAGRVAVTQWHADSIASIARQCLPSGSGIDSGCNVDVAASTPERIVITTAFHHMTEGHYDGWTEHSIIVTPSLTHGINIRITGRNRNNIKDYLAEVFHEALTATVEG